MPAVLDNSKLRPFLMRGQDVSSYAHTHRFRQSQRGLFIFKAVTFVHGEESFDVPVVARLSLPRAEGKYLIHTTSQSQEARDEARFKELTEAWRQDTKKLSIMQKKFLHPAYQKIIGSMNTRALPMIFRELSNSPSDWFWALGAITGRDDITASCATPKEAVAAWIKWGKDNGYI